MSLRTNGSGPLDLLWTDSVPDRSAHPDDVARSEDVSVIQDVVVMGFRAKEHVSPNVVADARTHIDEKMIRADVARAEVHAVARRLVSVKSRALPSDSAHQISAQFFAEPWLVNRVEVKNNRAIWLAAIGVVSLARSPACIEAESDTLMEDHVSTEIRVKATRFCAGECDCAASVISGGRHSSEAEHCVCLLC